MAKNRLVSERSALDIDKRVARVIQRLGNPEPPLQLDKVRELLELNLDYFQADDPSLMQETLVRLRIGSNRALQNAVTLADAVRKFSLRALFLPSQKRIMLERSLPPPKQRWNEGHEIGHSLIPWHLETMLGDNAATLSPGCHMKIEAEANYAAGRLLFLQGRFDSEALDSALNLSQIRSLSGSFANSISTTLWRFIEVRGNDLPLVGMLSAHPNARDRGSKPFDPLAPCRHFIQSRAFSRQFSRVTEVELFNQIGTYTAASRRGPLGSAEIDLKDDNGIHHSFLFDSFWNGYDALTLGVYLKPRAIII